MAEAVRVVIGAASGMGLDLAKRWAGQGPLVVADRAPSAIEGATVSLPCDVTDVAEIDAVAAAAASLGPLGALVVAAGLGPPDGTGEQILAVNLRGTAPLFDAFTDQVTEGSVVVGFASVAMFVAPTDPAILAVLDEPLSDDLPGRLRAVGMDVDDTVAAYASSKRGVSRLCKRWAAAWGPRGGRTVAIAPGLIDTPMGQRELDRDGGSRELRDGSALGRAGRPEEIDARWWTSCAPPPRPSSPAPRSSSTAGAASNRERRPRPARPALGRRRRPHARRRCAPQRAPLRDDPGDRRRGRDCARRRRTGDRAGRRAAHVLRRRLARRAARAGRHPARRSTTGCCRSPHAPGPDDRGRRRSRHRRRRRTCRCSAT